MYTFNGNIVSDLHKDAYGFRPQDHFWVEWNNSSDADKQHIWDRLLEALQLSIEVDANEKIAAVNAFELEIANALEVGAGSREEAVRWIVQGMDLDDVDLMYGGSAICYRKGLPYNMAAIFNIAINQLNYEVV